MMHDLKRFRILFFFFGIAIAYFYPNINEFLEKYAYTQSPFNSTNDYFIEREIINSWKRLINLPIRNLQRDLRVAVGVNTNVDLILSGTELVKKLNISSKNKLENHKLISNLNEFKECYSFFFRKGSAAERFFKNQDDFDKVLDAASDLNKQWFIGGNAALMADGIAKRFKNSQVLLVGPIGPKLKELLSSNIEIPKPSLIEKDEIHLIMEYGKHEIFENWQSPVANRFIVSHDIYNSKMEFLDRFFATIREYKPDIVLFSGLHLLESQTSEFRREKLASFKRHLEALKPNEKQVVHLELASIGDLALMKDIIDHQLLQQIDSLGLNEQELLFLAHTNEQAPHSNYYHEIQGQPELYKIVDILEWALVTFGSKEKSKLTRIHFHCLVYHIIAELDGDKWSNQVSSLVSGSKVAAKQACGFEFNDAAEESLMENLLELRLNYTFDEQKNYQVHISENQFVQFNISNPVIQFRRGKVKFYVTPVLVCKKPTKTVGLGDAISSTGLLYSEFN